MNHAIKMMAVVGLGLSLGADAAKAQDWTGFYGGLSVGQGSGEAHTVPPSSTSDLEGRQFGGFAGYNFQSGNLVYGGELAVNSAEIEVGGFSNVEYTRFVDLKARLGFASGPALFYGVLGYSWGRFEFSPETSNGSGLAIGLGADVMLGEQFFVGGEILRRNVKSGAIADVDGFESEITTFSLRAAMRF